MEPPRHLMEPNPDAPWPSLATVLWVVVLVVAVVRTVVDLAPS